MNMLDQLLTEYSLTYDDIAAMKAKHIDTFGEEPTVLILPSHKPSVSIYGMMVKFDNVSMPFTEGDRSKMNHQGYKNENR